LYWSLAFEVLWHLSFVVSRPSLQKSNALNRNTLITFALVVGKCCRVLSRHLRHLMWNLQNVFIFQVKEWTEHSPLSIFTLRRILQSLLCIPIYCSVGREAALYHGRVTSDGNSNARENNSGMKVVVIIIGQLQQGTESILISWNLYMGDSKCQMNLFHSTTNLHVLLRFRCWEH
jgi:hypothetical protein